jgi:DNA-binding NarL/FixJ family response regulator
VLKHAGPRTTTQVKVGYGDEDLDISVLDNGVTPANGDGRGERTDRYPRTGRRGRRRGRGRSRSRRRLLRPCTPPVRGGCMIHVVIADDQPLVRTGLRMILSTEADIEVVGEAANGTETVAFCATQKPDVVLMGVRMPEVDGIEATRRLTVSEDPPKILVLTTFDLDEVVYDALRAGASGFLLKDAPEQRLTTAIRVVAEGGSLFAPSVTRQLIEEFSGRAPLRPKNRSGRADRTRDRGALPSRTRAQQRRDRRSAVRHREHRQDPRWSAPPGWPATGPGSCSPAGWSRAISAISAGWSQLSGWGGVVSRALRC